VITVYRYGALAWVWRAIIAGALVAGGACAYFAVSKAALVLAVIGAVLVAPALFFGHVVATHIAQTEEGTMVVRSLLFTRRTITRDRLRPARVRQYAQGTVAQVYAPRAWIPVRGGFPVYVDLLADFPDPRSFASWWGVPAREIPRRR
jgi:hypothetical protein